MYILVQSITGACCEITNANTLSEIQSQIESQMGVPSSEQKLLLNGKLLTSESPIEDNSTISLVVALEGGAKGKKKKKDTKKGKKKHHKKKVKLAVLNYYKVEDDKVVRLKQMCKVCPPGTFIAEHEDSTAEDATQSIQKSMMLQRKEEKETKRQKERERSK